MKLVWAIGVGELVGDAVADSVGEGESDGVSETVAEGLMEGDAVSEAVGDAVSDGDGVAACVNGTRRISKGRLIAPAGMNSISIVWLEVESIGSAITPPCVLSLTAVTADGIRPAVVVPPDSGIATRKYPP